MQLSPRLSSIEEVETAAVVAIAAGVAICQASWSAICAKAIFNIEVAGQEIGIQMECREAPSPILQTGSDLLHTRDVEYRY